MAYFHCSKSVVSAVALAFVLLFNLHAVTAEEGDEKWTAIPDGSFEQIREFSENLTQEIRNRNKEFSEKYQKGETTQKEMDELQKFRVKSEETRKKIAEKILALPDLSKEAKVYAYRIKWNQARTGMYLSMRVKKLADLLEECEKDPDLSEIKKTAFGDWLRSSVQDTNNVEQLDKLFEKLLDSFKTDEQAAVYQCGDFFSKLASFPLEIRGTRMNSYFERLKTILENSKNEKVRGYLPKLEGSVRFNSLAGREMELKGISLDGKTVDLADFRGKIIYVDFWATWCGPCVGEMPQLHTTYRMLKDAGFELISYSIDEEMNDLTSFQDKHKYTWPTISVLKSKEKDFRDYYEYYGGGYVPKTVLIGRDGKVIETDIRGYQLEQKLKTLFAEVFEKKMDDPDTPIDAKAGFYRDKIIAGFSQKLSGDELEKIVAFLLENRNEPSPQLRSVADLLLSYQTTQQKMGSWTSDAKNNLISFAKEMREGLKDAKNIGLKTFSDELANLIRRLEFDGKPMEFEAVFKDGNQRSIADFHGKTILLALYRYHPIPEGMDEKRFHNPLPTFLDRLKRYDDEYRDSGLVILVYLVDAPEKIVSQIEKVVTAENTASVEDSVSKGLKNYWEFYGVRETPTFFLVDAEGRFVETKTNLNTSLKEYFAPREKIDP